MYGRLNQRKLREQDYILSCQKVRAQLSSSVDQQARRVNIDSAKKRAVLQHMDYEGFRQMVLGANIFPTKSAQLYKFSKGENTEIAKNKLYNRQQGQIENNEQTLRKMVSDQVFRRVQGKSQMQCNSFRQFKKKFNQYYPTSGSEIDSIRGEKLYNLIKCQDQSRITKIFNMQCEASILVKIVSVFEFINKYLSESDNSGNVVREVGYQIKLLEKILTLKNMKEFNLTVLSKKQKSKIVDFLLSTKQYILQRVNNTQQINNKQGQTTELHKQQTSLTQNNKNKQSTKDEDQKIIDSLVQLLSKK